MHIEEGRARPFLSGRGDGRARGMAGGSCGFCGTDGRTRIPSFSLLFFSLVKLCFFTRATVSGEILWSKSTFQIGFSSLQVHRGASCRVNDSRRIEFAYSEHMQKDSAECRRPDQATNDRVNRVDSVAGDSIARTTSPVPVRGFQWSRLRYTHRIVLNK